jgi:Uma2 family endonuclease
MVQRTPRATYQDLLDAPDNVRAELIDGELFLSPRPKAPHQIASSRLYAALYAALDGGDRAPGRWIFIPEMELHFDDREIVLVPDLSGWRSERLPDPVVAAGIDVPPDWLCEVLSASTERFDRHRKLPIYAAQGVDWVWLIDPVDCAIEIYRREPEGYLLLKVIGGDGAVRAPPFAAVELKLAPLWQHLSPKSAPPGTAP